MFSLLFGMVVFLAYLLIALPITVIMAPLFLLLFGILVVIGLICRRSAYRPFQALRALVGWGRGIGDLAKQLGMTTHDLRIFQPRYREQQIPKRSEGYRTLAIPDEPTMQLQRKLLATVLAGLRTHPDATGFVAGQSIVDNAQPHVGRAILVKIDIANFFPETRADRIQNYFQRVGWSRSAARLLTQLVCYQDGLPQGAPTSPLLSNVVNYKVDVNLSRFAQRFHGIYTRYADDLTFSFPKDYPRKMRGLVQYTRKVLKSAGYRIQWKKLRFLRSHQRQTVTGLNVNTLVSLPRKLRRQLRAARHHQSQGRPATWTPEQLQGWAALESMVRTQREQSSPPSEINPEKSSPQE